MSFDINTEGLTIINAYMNMFTEVIRFDELEIASLEELKTLLRQAIVKNESNLSSIKSVVSGIIGIINDPRSNAKDLKEIIEIDPPLTDRVLSLANSAYL
jgi:hypothetical protein